MVFGKSKDSDSENGSSFFDDSVRGGVKLFTHKGAYKAPDGTMRDTRATEPVSVDHNRTPIIAFYSPPAIYAAVVEYGAEKACQPWWKTFWLAILAGIYLSFGGAWAYSVGGQMPGLAASNPGAQELLFGLFGLPMGLGLIVICGAELYTTNAAYLPAALYEGRANLTQVGRSLILSFFGNLVGCLLVVWLFNETYLFDQSEAQKVFPFHIAQLKTGNRWGQEILRAIFCNYLVCLGVWQATAAQDITSKVIGIIFPISAFVSMSFSHTIANMFWVPFAITLGADVSVGRYIGSSMLPDLIGNTIAASMFLSGSYAFIYGTLPSRIYSCYERYTGRTRGQVNPSQHGRDLQKGSQTVAGIAARHEDIEA